MNRKLVGGLIGLAVLGVSTAASAHVDLAVGIGFPGQVYSAPAPVYVAPQPVYVAPQPVYAPAPYVAGPAPVAVGYWNRDDGREREWRRQEGREHARHEHEWRDRRGW